MELSKVPVASVSGAVRSGGPMVACSVVRKIFTNWAYGLGFLFRRVKAGGRPCPTVCSGSTMLVK